MRVPYTIIDVGFWYQIFVPTTPSGKLDYALAAPANEMVAGGDSPNILTDLWDLGRFVAKIILDERTLNKYVYTWGEVLTQNETVKLVEEETGEKVSTTSVSVKHHDCSATDDSDCPRPRQMTSCKELKQQKRPLPRIQRTP